MTIKNKIDLVYILLDDKERKIWNEEDVKRILETSEIFHVIGAVKLLTASTDYTTPDIDEIKNLIYQYITASQTVSQSNGLHNGD